MKKGKGSALIMVVVTLSILMVLGLSLMAVTQSELCMSQYNNKSMSAYYIAESGVERSLSLIRTDLKNIVDKVRGEACEAFRQGKLGGVNSAYDLQNYIDEKTNIEVRKYITYQDMFNTKISLYSGMNGLDGISLSSAAYPIKSYYTSRAYISESDEGRNTWKRIVIECTGHYGSGTRTILGKYKVSYPSKVETAPADYPDLAEYLSNALTVINNGSQVFDFCSIDVKGDVLIKSQLVQFRNSVLQALGSIKVKSRKTEIYNNVNIKGSTCFDYDSISVGSGSVVNDVKKPLITDTVIKDYKLYPAGVINETDELNNIVYISYNDNAVLDSAVFQNTPGAFHVIIANKNLELYDDSSREFVFNGIIYCNGLLKINMDRFVLNGSLICTNADFKGSININNFNFMTRNQLNEITSKIKTSVTNSVVSVSGDYEFDCYGWEE